MWEVSVLRCFANEGTPDGRLAGDMGIRSRKMENENRGPCHALPEPWIDVQSSAWTFLTPPAPTGFFPGGISTLFCIRILSGKHLKI